MILKLVVWLTLDLAEDFKFLFCNVEIVSYVLEGKLIGLLDFDGGGLTCDCCRLVLS